MKKLIAVFCTVSSIFAYAGGKSTCQEVVLKCKAKLRSGSSEAQKLLSAGLTSLHLADIVNKSVYMESQDLDLEIYPNQVKADYVLVDHICKGSAADEYQVKVTYYLNEEQLGEDFPKSFFLNDQGLAKATYSKDISYESFNTDSEIEECVLDREEFSVVKY